VKIVVDASAVLAVCKQEAGMEEARLHMRHGLISAVNLHEVFYKSDRLGKLDIAHSIIKTAGIRVMPFDERQALVATKIAGLTCDLPDGKKLSLADRACLSLGLDNQLPILTGDRKWSNLGLDVKLIFFRKDASN
jgi:ribonuclease VapC